MVTGWQNEEKSDRVDQDLDENSTAASGAKADVNNDKPTEQIPVVTGGWTFND